MDLSLSVEKIKGVGAKTGETFLKAGVRTVGDLVYFFPREYDNLAMVSKINEVVPGNVQVVAEVKSILSHYAKRRYMTVTEAVISDETGAIRVVWFNQAYRAKQLVKGKKYIFIGKYELSRGRYQLMSPRVVEKVEDKFEKERSLLPIYPMRAGVKSEKWQKMIGELRPNFFGISDLLPKEIELPDGIRKKALYMMHFPKNKAEVEWAKKYLAFEELFILILAARLNKNAQKRIKSVKVKFNQVNTKKTVAALPFVLTKDQRVATWEILQDLEKEVPMNRLLQGDVGSGKTVVAALAAVQVVAEGGQVAILAPTAILANQHAESMNKILEPLGVRVGLLTGSTKHKTELKKRIKSGEVDVVIGTHAILTDDTEFAKLALCVIDEQHRFGVEQRQKLMLKTNGESAPHLLAMTATPIPRSLQLTVFGDLDVSVLSTMPSGRKAIKTEIVNINELTDEVYPRIRERVGRGEQIYWICKNIEGEDEVVSVEKQLKMLKKEFSKMRIVTLHGRMKAKEKDEVMMKFAGGEIDILVSTTVVEVGVNVPNATMIIISNAEQYGLAQLHQLRGRVGRGEKASECVLIYSGEGRPPRRLTAMKKTTSGFELAELDLKERGPGEIYGSLQHGVMDLKIASFADTVMINKAGAAVNKFLQNGGDVLKYKELAVLLKKYQQITILN